jgi:hypothetical protein
MDPVIDSTVLNAPLIVCPIRDPAPRTTPLVPSKALTSNPYAGSSTKSLNPEPIFCTKVIGLPKMVRFPIIGRTIFAIPSW